MNRRPRVLYSLPDGAQSTVLLRTALLRELLNSGFDWIFVSPLAKHAQFVESLTSRQAKVEQWPVPQPAFFSRQITRIREELWKLRIDNESTRIFTRRMPWTEPKRFYFHHQVARVAKHLPLADPSLEWLENRFAGDRTWDEFLRRVQPDVVVLGSGGIKPQENPLARAVRRQGLPCFGIVPSWDNLTSKGPLVARSHRLAVWCNRMRSEAVALHGYRPEDVAVTGPPLFDPHFETVSAESRRRFFQQLGLDPARKLIVYTSVPTGTCPTSSRYAELLARRLNEGRFASRCQLLVRTHPQDDFDAFERLRTIPGVVLDRPGSYFGKAKGYPAILKYFPTAEEVRHLTETLAAADVIVNVASTITLESCLLDRPVVNIGFNLTDEPGFSIGDYYGLTHYKPVTESGAVEIAHSETELWRAIDNALLHPESRSRERARLYQLFDEFGDGAASVRLADAITTFVKDSLSLEKPIPRTPTLSKRTMVC